MLKKIFLSFQKENKETVDIEFKKMAKAIKELGKYTHWNDKLGVGVKFKFHLTMVDSGAVNKATGNDDQHKCRVCLQRPWTIRNQGNQICDHVHYCLELDMSLLDFGGSPTHNVIHVGMWLVDLAIRRESQAHNKRGFTAHHNEMEKIV